MNTIHTICIVDDDEEIRSLLSDYLRRNGFSTCTAGNAAEFLEVQRRVPCSLIVMDIMLPGMNGLELFRTLRAESTVPVIFLTASDDEYSTVAGLDMGAVDYIAKPFRARELISRIRGALRRTAPASNVLTVGDVRLDVASAAVTKDGREVFLSALEYRLLLYFLQHKGKLVTRENLRDAIWDSAGEYVSDNALNVYVKRLREKVETDPAEPELIVTVRGLGYKVGE